jgi:anti-repressor protein|nr:MAG TPA: antirepressor protein [Caudoviricetes sp.]DAW02024.1 MAG TPA: antirepressor protein [Caudoviricetes sp.]
MNELLKIDTSNAERITVSARDLYEFLEATERFNSWFERMTQYGLTEGEDFNPLKSLRVQTEGNREVQREVDDYQLTIDTAKQIAMLQRNEKGTQARKYFIQVENAWNSPERVMARALEIAHKTIATLEIENKEMKPKALFADAVAQSDTSILVYDLAKLICQNGVKIGGNRLWTWLRDNGYIFKHSCEPTQKSMEMKLFEVIERTVQRSGHDPKVTRTTRVTGKGQVYFINKVLQDYGNQKN